MKRVAGASILVLMLLVAPSAVFVLAGHPWWAWLSVIGGAVALLVLIGALSWVCIFAVNLMLGDR